MKILKIVSLCGYIVIALTSCSNDKEMALAPQTAEEEMSPVFTKLQDILCRMVSEEPNRTEDIFVMYDAEDGSLDIYSKDEYELIYAFAELLSPDRKLQREPAGNGWNDGGRYKNNNTEIIKAVKDIGKQIPANRNFELHVEYNKDGTFTAWWCLV